MSGASVVAVGQVTLLIAVAPLVRGLIDTIGARVSGRRGRRLLQPYYDLVKFSRKAVVVPTTASWLFVVAPTIVLATTILAASLVPVVFVETAGSRAGGLLALVGLLALGRVCLALAGLDSGTPGGGLGSSRQMTFAALSEPGLLLSLFTPALVAGSTDLAVIVRSVAEAGPAALTPSHLLAFVALAGVVVVATGRMPSETSAAPSSSTTQGVLTEEYSGGLRALIELASAVKLVVLLTLLCNVFVPFGIALEVTGRALGQAVLAYGIKLLALAGAIALLESVFATLRIARAPDILATSSVMGILALFTTVTLR